MNKKGIGAAFLMWAIVGVFLLLNLSAFTRIVHALTSNPVVLLIGIAVLALFISKK